MTRRLDLLYIPIKTGISPNNIGDTTSETKTKDLSSFPSLIEEIIVPYCLNFSPDSLKSKLDGYLRESVTVNL